MPETATSPQPDATPQPPNSPDQRSRWLTAAYAAAFLTIPIALCSWPGAATIVVLFALGDSSGATGFIMLALLILFLILPFITWIAGIVATVIAFRQGQQKIAVRGAVLSVVSIAAGVLGVLIAGGIMQFASK